MDKTKIMDLEIIVVSTVGVQCDDHENEDPAVRLQEPLILHSWLFHAWLQHTARHEGTWVVINGWANSFEIRLIVI